MQIDLNLIPSTLDIVHVGLAAVAALLLLLSILLAVISAFALSRRTKAVPAPSQPAIAPSAVAPVPVAAQPVEPPKPVVVKEATPEAALQLLGLLQQEARFLDFVQENIAGHGDADIGAAVRVVHEGCRKVLKQHLELEPVRTEAENSRVTLPKGYDAGAVRVSGNIVGEPPFTGTLIHRGWRASRIQLPRLAEGHDARILAPAEVEL
ncbi:MAG: DUF2760 domain-containing protein [Methylococcus sp.]|nr:MAG: DUF2760 domain-containing protein [Methylococcus sp.]